ncbi:hypothetical protein AAMO2058_000486100 [Amorphochlora amoebiformis]
MSVALPHHVVCSVRPPAPILGPPLAFRPSPSRIQSKQRRRTDLGEFGGREREGRLRCWATETAPSRVQDASKTVISAGIGFILVTLALLVKEESTASNLSAIGGRNLASPVGWVAVLGAILLFGSSGIFFKDDDIDGSNVSSPPDPVLFQAFNALGIFLASSPLLLYEIANSLTKTPESLQAVSENLQSVSTAVTFFDPLGIVGAGDILVISYFASLAVRGLGYATAPAVWAGVGMMTSFAIGHAFFGEGVRSQIGALGAIGLLVAGVLQVAQTRQSDSEKNQVAGSLGLIGAVGVAVIAGIFDGSLMVPFKIHTQSYGGSLESTLSYLASFGVGSLATTPPLLALSALRARNEGEKEWSSILVANARRAAIPGIGTGVLWTMANFLSAHATEVYIYN